MAKYSVRMSKLLVLCILMTLIITALIALYPLHTYCRCAFDADRPDKVMGEEKQHTRPNDRKEKAEESPPNDHPEWGPHTLGIIVPFRDRFDELMEFAPHMHSYLNKKKVRHKIFIVNQVDGFRFNRASLINIGFSQSDLDGCDYIAMHDVDLLPLNPGLDYGYPEERAFHVAAPNLHPLYHYDKYVGGILLVNNKDYRRMNGMSNRYWGWGREDDEFYLRMKMIGLKVARPVNITTGKQTFKHLHDKQKRKRDYDVFFDQRKKTGHLDRSTGLHNVRYILKSRKEITIEGAAVTVLNVLLKCDLTATPWCLKKEDHEKFRDKIEQGGNY